jgi:hypothetical protein
LHRTHAIRASEDRALRGKSVEVWRPGVGIAECGDGVSALIIAEEEENVGTRSVGCEKPPGQNQGEERDEKANASVHEVVHPDRAITACLSMPATHLLHHASDRNGCLITSGGAFASLTSLLI